MMQARSWLSSTQKKLRATCSLCAWRLLRPAKEKGVRVWHAMSRTVNNINSYY